MTERPNPLHASSMPMSSPAYPAGPYDFMNREFLVITYRTDREAIEAVLPEPFEIDEPIVKYEFIRMPDSTGFGNYTESGQVIPVRFNGTKGGYVHAMFLNNEAPIAGGREIWGFPKKYAHPTLTVEGDTLLGTLEYGPVRIATGTMGYKYEALDKEKVRDALLQPNYLLKIIPHVDGTPRICEIVDYRIENLVVKGAWSGPADLELHAHALAPIADLPVREVISGVHLITDLTLGMGKVVHDYLA